MTVDEVFDKVIFTPLMYLTGICLGALMFVGIPLALYLWMTYVPPETFALRVDSWHCSISHKEETRVCSKGCYWRHDVICDQWSRK